MLDIWRSTEGSKYNKLYHYHLLNGSSLPITGTESSYQPMDGWFTEGDRITRDGTEYVLYYPEDYIDDYYIARSEGETPDESRAQAVPASETVLTRSYTVGAILKEAPDFLGTGDLYLLYPYSMYEAVTGQAPAADAFWFRSSDHAASYESMGQILMELGNSRSELQDLAANGESQRAMVTVVNVFSYGFIILISLISMTNVFNTISTSIALRRREFAMLRSVGLTQRGFARMMDYECIIYGARALLWGLPASVLVTYGIYRSVAQSIAARFYIPWYSVAIAVGSVFVVVFATMLYATRKIRSENPIEALKQENL
ncbi:MAG: ABC transporter permease [Oscillospiraceae bacterium]